MPKLKYCYVSTKWGIRRGRRGGGRERGRERERGTEWEGGREREGKRGGERQRERDTDRQTDTIFFFAGGGKIIKFFHLTFLPAMFDSIRIFSSLRNSFLSLSFSLSLSLSLSLSRFLKTKRSGKEVD